MSDTAAHPDRRTAAGGAARAGIRIRLAATALTALLGATVVAGCAQGRRPASHLPVGADAWYGDHTDDGVTLTLPLDAGAAMQAVREALQAAGYDVEEPVGARRVLRTAPRKLGGDTTMVITAHTIPLELAEPASSIVLTATYSVPSRRLRNAPVIQRPGQTSPLYARLRAVADTLRRSRARAP